MRIAEKSLGFLTPYLWDCALLGKSAEMDAGIFNFGAIEYSAVRSDSSSTATASGKNQDRSNENIIFRCKRGTVEGKLEKL